MLRNQRLSISLMVIPPRRKEVTENGRKQDVFEEKYQRRQIAINVTVNRF